MREGVGTETGGETIPETPGGGTRWTSSPPSHTCVTPTIAVAKSTFNLATTAAAPKEEAEAFHHFLEGEDSGRGRVA